MQEYATHIMAVTLVGWIVYLRMVVQVRPVGTSMMVFVVGIVFKIITWRNWRLDVL